ncbi:MAG TPA: NADH-quinone oxidoreductase subunit J [bacterium]|nr:NADH-quinone oxidoreductase subunit J [bacterium]
MQSMNTILFYLLAASAVFSALATITRRSPPASAIWLVVSLLSVAGIFGMLGAPFLAALQVLIAAGAVMVLFLFVIMLVDQGEESLRPRIVSFGRVLGAVASGYLALILILAIWKPPFVEAPKSGAAYEAPLTLALAVVGRYALVLELVGVMLLVAAVAAISLAKRDTTAGEG